MMRKKNLPNCELKADIAGRRAEFYDFLVGGWIHIPALSYVEKMKGPSFDSFLNACCNHGGIEFKKGAGYIQSYRSNAAAQTNDALIVEELAVDRTCILRGTGPSALMPPYEGLYKGKKSSGQPLLEIKRFYRKSGLILEDMVNEAPDFICVQLDFMKHMCRREQRQWSSAADATDTIAQENAFLKRHLGSWVNDFCLQVQQHARTDFYRGMAMVMAAFIGADMSYIEEMIDL